MRKTILLLLLLALALTAGCGESKPPSAATPEPTASAEPTATPEPTAAADMTVTVVWNGTEYTGLYTGGLKKMKPDGEGRFSGANAAAERFAWDGGWAAGEPSGRGMMTLDALTVTLEDETQVGTYTGEAADGVPDGEGEFASADAEGLTYTYSGHWSAGQIDGQGTLRYASENRYVRSGTFTQGRYTPAWKEALLALGTCEPQFSVTGAQMDFIDQYPALTESASYRNYMKSPYKKLYDHSLNLKRIFQKPELLETPKWMGMSSARIIRSWTIALGEHRFTCITGADGSYDYPIRVIIPEAIEGLRRGQRFHFYAIPLAMSEYTTVRGEKQSCLVLLAGDVYIAV